MLCLIGYLYQKFRITNHQFSIKEHEYQTEKLYYKIKTLYQELFELEELCENLILELQDEDRQKISHEHKNRIIQSSCGS